MTCKPFPYSFKDIEPSKVSHYVPGYTFRPKWANYFPHTITEVEAVHSDPFHQGRLCIHAQIARVEEPAA